MILWSLLSYSSWDATCQFGSYEWTFQSQFCELTGNFISSDSPVTPRTYQVNFVIFTQSDKGLMAVPDWLRFDLAIVTSFHCSFTDRYNADVSVLVAPIYILNYACLDGTHFCLEYRGVLPKLLPHTKSIHKGHSTFICLEFTCVPLESPVSVGLNPACQETCLWDTHHVHVLSFCQSLSVGRVHPPCPMIRRHACTPQIWASIVHCNRVCRSLFGPQPPGFIAVCF